MYRQLMQKWVAADLGTSAGRALVEERYWSLRRQVPIVYLLGFVNLSGMELATSGHLAVGLNLPTFIVACGVLRLIHWFGYKAKPTHRDMVRRMVQTVWFAALVCLAVCARCLHLLTVGDSSSHMAVMLFGGLTAIGVSYGLTALPVAGAIPLLLIVGPISVAACLSPDPLFPWAAFGLVVVAALTLRLLAQHSRHFSNVIMSRSTITAARLSAERAHQEAMVAATTDFLTGLPNRRAFVAALEAAIAAASGPFAVGIMDLDRFKSVNDTFGHAAGDSQLREVAERLLRAVDSRGIVARLGGDEFGILLPAIRSPGAARSAGAAILREVNQPVTISGRQLAVSACCGFGIGRPDHDLSPSRLMADADLALYQSKSRSSGGVAVFELRMEAPRRRRQRIEQALQAPGVCDQMRLVYQPIVEFSTGRIIAQEALARWTDAELGPVSPAEFVPIAEQLHLIDDINHHLMSQAFGQAHFWPETVKLSFNLSSTQLCSPGSAAQILEALARVRLKPDRLQVEVTETALLSDFDQARGNLARLKAAGITIVLDDFGAGFASIGYLRELQFDQIKLDGALVTAALISADSKRLLSAVIGLCSILGVSSVAEHVESEESLKALIDLGCTAGQGFWLQAPLEASEIAFVATQGCLQGGAAQRRLRAA